MVNCTTTVQGLHYVEWAAKYFDTCVYTDLEKASLFIGLSSIGCWLFAQVP